VFNDVIDLLFDAIKESAPGVEVIVGLESRGFLFGPILSQRLGIPFVPIRKKGKLPGELVSVAYQLEYGSDSFEAQKDSIEHGQKVLVFDDLLATGGTMKAACDLVEQLGALVSLCLVIVELVDLDGRKKVSRPVKSLLTYTD
jgi:adenine phosphoribosyltransferase